ncbi:hypothetical protein K461DRAFT_223472 [Myriangium duriaei CBS 260.36]|uniref:DUF7918 domain-containing protein n=1 Tax=Myriangium duriaei CBS 260.36 TaxID=1168546 RepID=A0A9P4J2X1_9PEZI|nr:hypothetical protein K461DRAFT_223472 [Myriangium duriaei CBS 260.36]
MPCFKGLAVSIHTPEGPLAEYSIQKQSRQSRITSYIPVPPPRIPNESTTGKPEQSTFAVSITLLVPGQRVPYSAPKPSPEEPFPLGKVVGSFPGTLGDRGRYGPIIGPYIPRTASPNETLAAYIYFDGRPKEEVATLLRRGEETWVNSRWVSIPASEGGGIAEREFLFREVGLERWLNGLDLVGKDKEKAAKIEKRHRKLERRRQAQMDDSDDDLNRKVSNHKDRVLRYGADAQSPVESLNDENDLSSDDSDDEPPEAEAAGQIKVALFRVLASGEVKRGEYEPQFDAHDDDGEANDGDADADIEHTTSLAKPKSLDPKSISTQTVTGLDPPDAPYAVFTFLYRSDKQLRKMGMLESTQVNDSPVTAKRKSTDFSKLGPLNKFGTVGFTGYREQANPKKQDSKGDNDMMDDSDADDDEHDKKRNEKDDDEPIELEQNGQHLSPMDARKQGELTEGVRKIKLKRVHSSDPVTDTRKSPHLKTTDSPPAGPSAMSTAGTPNAPKFSNVMESTPPNGSSGGVASPFKKHRPSLDGIDSITLPPMSTPAANTAATSATDATNSKGQVAPPAALPPAPPAVSGAVDEDEEL